MITVLVQFQLPHPATREKARDIFLSTAPKYRETPGLIRKNYLLSQDGKTAGGAYLWKSREAADRLYTDDWKKFVEGKYGKPPQIEYLHSPVMVDNRDGSIKVAA